MTGETAKPTCAKNAQVQTAPAEMPGVEEEQVARIIRDAGIDEYEAARAILDLFAPILAEKELHHATGERITRKDLNNAHRKGAEEGRLAAHLIDGVNSPLNACCYRDGCRALEARALAAEAENKRLEGVLARYIEEVGSREGTDFIDAPGYNGRDEAILYRCSGRDAEGNFTDEARAIAAAIRAQIAAPGAAMEAQ